MQAWISLNNQRWSANTCIPTPKRGNEALAAEYLIVAARQWRTTQSNFHSINKLIATVSRDQLRLKKSHQLGNRDLRRRRHRIGGIGSIV